MIDIIKNGGWGDSFFIETPAGQKILVDTGIGKSITNAEIPLLTEKLSESNNRLDVLLLTHAHADHFSGIPAVAHQFKIGQFIGPPNTPISISKTLSAKNVPIVIPHLGQTFDWGGGVTATAINVYDPKGNGLEDDGQRGRNNNSIVLKLQYGKTSVLLTGDLEAEGEGNILKRSYDIKSDVLKCGHHGVENRSEDSSSYDFLMKVNPKFVLISGGGVLLKPWTMEKFHLLGADVFIAGSERKPVELVSNGREWSKPPHMVADPYEPIMSGNPFTGDTIELYPEDDKIHYRGHWEDNKLEGKWQLCNKNGEEGQFWYKNGVRDGPGYFFKKDGTLWGESYADKGVITQSWIYFSMGKVWKSLTTDEQGNVCRKEFDEKGNVVLQEGNDIPPRFTAPSFIEKPGDQIVYPGDKATFNVQAAGVPYPSIQWFEDGQVITGANSPAYTTKLFNNGDTAKTYTVVLSNGGGEVKATAKLLIDSKTEIIKPVIRKYPTNVKVHLGESASFTVDAVGNPLHYQWQKKTGPKWYDIPQGTNSTYSIMVNSKQAPEKYRVIVSNPSGSISSEEVLLTIR